MGMFSNKKKTIVNTAISRLIEDKDIPNLNEVALYDYLYSNAANRNSFVDFDRSYSTHIIAANANSISAKMRTARRWADRNYAYDLPSSTAFEAIEQNITGKLESYLQDKEGKNVRLAYGLFMPANALHITWQKLVDHHGYDLNSNVLQTLSTQLGTTAYLEDIVVHYCSYTYKNLADPETVMQYGLAATHGFTPWRAYNRKAEHTPFLNDPLATKDFSVVTYSYLVNGSKVYGSFEVDYLDYEWSGLEPEDGLDDSDAGNIDPEAVAPIVDDVDAEKDYIIAQYFVVNTDGAETLKLLTYEYGSGLVSELENLFSPTNVIGSFFPNIYLRLYGNNLADDRHHETDQYKSSKKLCAKIGLKYKQVSDDIHKAVGSLEYVTQILISNQLKVNSGDEDVLVHEYMYEYFYNLYGQLPKQVADTEYTSLDKNYVNGYAKSGMMISIADKAYSSNIGFKSIGYVDKIGSIGPIGKVTKAYAQEMAITAYSTKKGLVSFIRRHIYRKQLTANSYRELNVYGLTSTQRVSGGKSTSATGRDENLYIPIDDLILDKFPTRERVILLSKSLIVMINTLQVIKQKWYETGIFKVIMVVVAVVISVYSGGAGATLMGVITATAQTIAIGVAVSIAIKFLVKKLDINMGALFAIVAVVLIIVGAGAALSNTGSVMGMTAPQFMQAANYSIQVSAESNKLEMAKLAKSHAEYSMEMEAKLKELAELEEEMNPDKYLTPYYLMTDSIRIPDIRVGEILNDFITRTLSVDSGLAPIGLIPNMVDVTLRLPTFQQTYRKMVEQRSSLYEL